MRVNVWMFLVSIWVGAGGNRFFSGSFVPYSNCAATYNAPCSLTNAHAVVRQTLELLEAATEPDDVQDLVSEINGGRYANGADGHGFGPVIVQDGRVLTDPDNDDVVNLTVEEVTPFDPDILTRWKEAAADDGWTTWIWKRKEQESDLRVGFVQSVNTSLGFFLVMSSFTDEPLVTGFEDATVSPCLVTHNSLCSIVLSRRLVGDGLTRMMMAEPSVDLQVVFYEMTFHSSAYKLGSNGGFYIFAHVFGEAGDPGQDGEAVAHGSRHDFIGHNVTEILTLVGCTAVNGTAVHEDFSAAAMNGGGWVRYSWQDDPSSDPHTKIAFVAGTIRFGTKYYLGVSFDNVPGDVERGPHCTVCSAAYNYPCSLRNTYTLIGHVLSLLLTEVDEATAWSKLTSSNNAAWGLATEAGFTFDGGFYPFVYSYNGTDVAHGANGAFVGLSLWSILATVGINSGCDEENQHCTTTNVDGVQLHEQFVLAAERGGGWVRYRWKNSANEEAYDKVAYLVKVRQFGDVFYAGVGFNDVTYFGDTDQCSALYNAACSEDNVLGLVGSMSTAIVNAQSTTELAATLNASTFDSAYKRDTGFFLQVFAQTGTVAGHGERPGVVGLSLEALFQELGSKVLSSDDYFSSVRSEGWFTYNWQGTGDATVKKKKAFALKATYGPLGSSVDQHFYVVSSFIDEDAPPLCAHGCSTGSSCDAATGRCECEGSTPVSSFSTVDCSPVEDCSCETRDSVMNCLALTSSCPAGQKPNPSDYSTCIDCDLGKFSTAGATECSFCTPGSSQRRAGQTSCSECTMGTFSNLGGATQCEACGLGFYQEQVGASTCEKCDVGQWANRTQSTACIQCPVGETTLERAATSVWDCVCQENSYRGVGHSEANASSSSCLSCQKDLQGNWVMDCPPSNDEPRILAGFWAFPEDRATRVYSIYSCRNSVQCLTGFAGVNCAAGRVGRSCANCALHFKAGPSGTCIACDSNDTILACALAVGALLFICAIVHQARTDTNKVHVATLAMGVCVSQAAVAVQTLAIFNGIQVNWVDPMKGLLAIVSVMSLSFEDLSLSCTVEDSQVVPLYVGKLMIFPTCIGLIVLLLFILSRCGKPLRPDAILNSVGVLFLLLFLTLAMVALEPFHCVMNPNGTHSMHSNPSVECFAADTWSGLAVLGCVGVMVYCVLFYAWVLYTVNSYPRLVASGQGFLIMNRYRFLFQRFTVDCYYYAPIYLCRNFGIAVLPTLFADYDHRQVFLLSVLLLIFGFLQAWLQPWRGFIPNFIDTSTTSSLIMTLLGAAFLFDINADSLSQDLRLCFIVIFCVAFCCFVVPMTFLMYRRFVPRMKYAAFLCHHKGGCAVGARLVKLELEHRLKARIFLDSDELDNLENLLDIVRCATRHLVVLLTEQTLSRPWCAGEVATAYANDVSTICVAFDDYKEFTLEDLSLNAIQSRWSAEAFAPCVSQGVSLEIVLKAFSKVASIEKIHYPRVAACLNNDPSATQAALDRVCAACSSKTFLRSAKRTPTRQIRVPGTREMDLAVLASNTDAEAISTAGVVAHMVRLQAQWITSEVLHTRDVESSARPKSICVVLTEGCLTSEGFARTLHAAHQAWSDAELVTVRGERFAFPLPDVLATTVSLMSRATGLDKVSFEKLYRKVLSVLSLPFTPSGHRNVLEVEIRGIVSKVNRMQNQPRMRLTPRNGEDEDV